MHPPFAAIFDWDGVVIDSHDQHERSWFLLAGEIGKPLTREQFRATFGQRNETILPLLGWADEGDPDEIERLGDRKEELYRELIRKDGIDPLPGVLRLLMELEERDIPRGVGSSTPRANIDCIMEMTGTAPFFSEIVAAADVSRGKPDPEVFVTCASRLGMPPGSCVVFEDAHAGVQAAQGGGMRTVALTTTHAADTFSELAPDRIVQDLSEVDVALLEGVFAEGR